MWFNKSPRSQSLIKFMNLKKQYTYHLERYSLLQITLATVFYNILDGIFNEQPVHIGIDSYAPLKEFQKYRGYTLSWWIDHISGYQIVDCSVAVLSVWFRLTHQRANDIFEKGQYFYSSRSGSFEIETNENGLLSTVFVFFDRQAPEYLKQLFHDFPGSAYPTKTELLNDMRVYDTINDQAFLEGLKPIPYQTIVIE